MPISTALLRSGYVLLLIAALSIGCETHTPAADVDEPAAEIADEPAGDEAEISPEQLKKQPATHRQTAIIHATSGQGGSLKAFVIAPDGNILALVQLGTRSDDDDEMAPAVDLSISTGQTDKKTKQEKPPAAASEVRTFSPDGKHERIGAWPVSFMAQTMGLGPDDCLYIAGSGRVARYRLDGTELAIADSPQAVLIDNDPAALREAAEAQIEAEKERTKQMTAAFQQQRDAIVAQIEKSPDKRKQAQLDQLDRQIKQLSPQERTVDQVMVEVKQRLKRVNAIAASDKEVFITCPQTKGYGYSVWRTDLDFSNPKSIVTGLSGCCGQMDVCCASGDLWVAENSRHRVVRYDREGKRLAAFGKRDRDGVGGSFGGCCNPMNLCFDKSGDLLVAESNGQVKHFTAKGKFVELAGVAGVQAGCKNSAVRVSPDGEQIYYIDVQKSQILVLARNKTDAKADD